MADYYIPKELEMSNALITAAETDDEIGTILRLHLVVEQLLIFHLKRNRIGEIATYAKEPRNFGGKLSLSVAFGLPIPLARIAHHINKIRNKIAHNPEESINPDDIKELARKVNCLSEIDSSFTPIEKRYVELPAKRPGEKIAFGSDSCRIDFLIAVMGFYSFFLRWLLSSDLKNGANFEM